VFCSSTPIDNSVTEFVNSVDDILEFVFEVMAVAVRLSRCFGASDN